MCSLVILDARLDHKLKALEKHMRICQELKKEVLQIEEEKKFTYFQMMGGKGVY